MPKYFSSHTVFELFDMRTQYAAVSFYLALVPATYASFHIADTSIGRDFLSGFHWETFDDPTQGRVNFINQSTALSSNLTYGKCRLPQRLLIPYLPCHYSRKPHKTSL